MAIKRAKQEIKDSIEAYLAKDEFGDYRIPAIRQRPIFLVGPPGIGKTQIMEQIAKECRIGLVAYTITHHTRQSAVGLPFIQEKEYGGKTVSVTEYTMSEIIASVYDKIEKTGIREGILFLDEINSLPINVQGKLLRTLEEKSIQRIGSTKTKKVDFRLIAATNRNLQKLVEQGKFREDLYYRIQVIPLTIPPVRKHAQTSKL